MARKTISLFESLQQQYGLGNTDSFCYYNCNPYNVHTDDCVLRAVSAGTGESWDKIVSDLTKYMLKHGYMMNTPEIYGLYLKDKGWVHHKAPTKGRGKCMTIGEFVEKFDGHAIAHVDDNHVTYIADGKVWDLWDPSEHQMGEYWIPKSEIKKGK